MKGMIGKKIGMTTYFVDREAVSSTVISVVPNTVIQVKTPDKDGYSALKLGIDEKKPRFAKATISQSPKDKVKKDKKISYAKIQELLINEEEIGKYKKGDKLDLGQFQLGDKIIVSGISKGKGFAGVIKRHGFSSGPETHGSEHHRAPGSIGSMFPQKVFRGKKMPGRMGQQKITVKNLEVINLDPKNNLLCVKGAVPGKNGSFVFLRGISYE